MTHSYCIMCAHTHIGACTHHRYIKGTRLLTVRHSRSVAKKPAGRASAAMLRGNFYTETHYTQCKNVAKYSEKISFN